MQAALHWCIVPMESGASEQCHSLDYSTTEFTVILCMVVLLTNAVYTHTIVEYREYCTYVRNWCLRTVNNL